MIKQAEVQNAYLMGRQAAMTKLAQKFPTAEGVQADSTLEEQLARDPNVIAQYDDGFLGMRDGSIVPPESSHTPLTARAKDAIMAELAAQRGVLDNIGLTGRGFSRNMDAGMSEIDPMNLKNYMTLENLARAGMLGGAVGGGVLNPSLAGAGISTAGALGGGILGGNLGRALGAGLEAYRSDEFGNNRGTVNQKAFQSGGGALGGLLGGLGAGYMSR